MRATEIVVVRYQKFDAHADAIVLVQHPMRIRPDHQEVRAPILRPDGGSGWLVLTDCGGRDPFGSRIYEDASTAVKH